MVGSLMTRLIDLMRRQKNFPLFDYGSKKWQPAIGMNFSIPGLPIFVIDNVCEYMQETSKPYDWSLEAFANVAPPFAEFFVETRVPGHKELFGVLFQALSAEQNYDPQDKFYSHIQAETSAFGPDCRWKMIASPYHFDPNGPDFVYRTMPLFIFEIRANGSISKLNAFGCDEGEDALFEKSTMYYPFLLALTFIHCKNVETVDVEPSVKLSRAVEKRKGVPLTRYKTLIIKPMTEEMKTQGANTGPGTTQKALHLCRGHFKDYRTRGLFGKIKELFWFGPQMRGSADNGVVQKDYEVVK